MGRRKGAQKEIAMKSVFGMTMTAVLSAATPAQASDAEARDLFKQVIEIPTVQGRGEVPRLISLLSEKLRAEGIDNITVKPYGETAGMIVRWLAAKRSKIKPMLLMAHLDVVEAKRADWQDDPFIFREKEGYYWGRGAVDNKAGVVAIIRSLIDLKRSGFKPKRDIIVLFTGDEETAGDGARLASTQWRSLIEAEFALNTDAGGGGFTADGKSLGYGLQTAEKTYRTYNFTVRNKGGHSSRPRPDNAIYDLSSALTRLVGYRFAPEMNETTKAYMAARAKQETGALGDAMRRWIANPKDEAAADIIEADEKEIGLTRTRCVATRLSIAGSCPVSIPTVLRPSCKPSLGPELRLSKATPLACPLQPVRCAPMSLGPIPRRCRNAFPECRSSRKCQQARPMACFYAVLASLFMAWAASGWSSPMTNAPMG
jgi:hypothetical protein